MSLTPKLIIFSAGNNSIIPAQPLSQLLNLPVNQNVLSRMNYQLLNTLLCSDKDDYQANMLIKHKIVKTNLTYTNANTFSQW